jgi:hypothetical protein
VARLDELGETKARFDKLSVTVVLRLAQRKGGSSLNEFSMSRQAPPFASSH